MTMVIISETFYQLVLKDQANNKTECTQQKNPGYGENYLLINGLRDTPSSPTSFSIHTYGLSRVSYNQLT